jgi:Flp pilus assembly protein TadG
MRLHRSESSHGQKGVTLIWMAFFLIVLLMFIALGVDMAKLMVTRSQLQNAADAAALAGASAFKDKTGTEAATLATTMAQAAALSNKAYQGTATNVILDAADVSVDTDSQTVAVTVRRDSSAGTPMLVSFLQVVGVKSLNVRARATAKANGGCNLWPVAGRPDPGPEFQVGCIEYVLKYGSGSGTQGSYGPLDLTGLDCKNPYGCVGAGGAAYRCYLDHGFSCCIDSGTCIPSENGNMTGPTVDGITARFAADTDQRQGVCYFDPVAPYHGNDSRVVTVPITGPLVGKCYTVKHYGRFFLTRIPGKGNKDLIYANYLGRADDTGSASGSFHVYLIK